MNKIKEYRLRKELTQQLADKVGVEQSVIWEFLRFPTLPSRWRFYRLTDGAYPLRVKVEDHFCSPLKKSASVCRLRCFLSSEGVYCFGRWK